MVVTNFRRAIALSLILGGLPAIAAAAECPTPAITEPRSALEFRIAESFRLDALLGTSVSWKRYDGRMSAWRLGLSPEMSRFDTSSTEQQERERQPGLAVEGQRLRFLGTSSRACPYWGFGVQAGMTRSFRETFVLGQVDLERQRTHRSTALWAGLVATLGAEFAIAHRVVLGAEYSLTAVVVRNTVTQYESDGNPEENHFYRSQTTSTRYEIRPRGVALTFAILF